MINFWKKQYEQETPIPAKFLLPDGSITDTLPGGGGGSMDNYYNKREVNDLLDEVANNASQEIANQINDTSSDRNHTLSSAEVDTRISDSIVDIVETGNTKAVTSNAVNEALADYAKKKALKLSTDLNNETDICYFNSTTSNRPSDYGNYGICQIFYGNNGKWIWQYAYLTNGNTARRYKMEDSGNTWSDWEKLVTESDLKVTEYNPTPEITLWKQGKRVTGIIKASNVTMSGGIKDLGTVPQGLFPKTVIYVSAVASGPYTPVLVGILTGGIIRVYSDKSSLEYLYCNFTYYVD